jgi:BirA family biotin operon repressor/biotin-[acetyl-CoA-carboxylase] ligase
VRELAPDSKLAGACVVREVVDSTMDWARSEAGERAAPFVVAADQQTGGRGQAGRTWHSPGGGLYFTAAIGLEPGPELPPFTLACGVAIHAAVEAFVRGRKLSLKWPNDLWWERKKLAGVLCESVEKVVLVGVGVNVNTEEFPEELEIATSMRMCAGRSFEREAVLAGMLVLLEQSAGLYAEKGFGAFAQEYRRRCLLWGRTCEVEGKRGVMEDVDEGGALLLGTEGGRERVISGHVVLLD